MPHNSHGDNPRPRPAVVPAVTVGGEFGRSYLLRFLNAGRHLVPLPMRRRLRDAVFRRTRIRWTRSSGVRLRIEDDNDWRHYTEIFRHGEYDQAIRLALSGMPDAATPVVLDLGANLGFFTLRAVELARQSVGRPTPRVVAVEANALLASGFRNRVMGDNGLVREVTLVGGLVGERSGAAIFYTSSTHGDSSLFRSTGSASEVDYVDLSRLLAGEPRVDLLKCDVEGAELSFIRNYRDLLAKVRVATFELHADLCDIQTCRAMLNEYGLTQTTVVRHAAPYSLECFWR